MTIFVTTEALNRRYKIHCLVHQYLIAQNFPATIHDGKLNSIVCFCGELNALRTVHVIKKIITQVCLRFWQLQRTKLSQDTQLNPICMQLTEKLLTRTMRLKHGVRNS